jgi:hypothetical protein
MAKLEKGDDLRRRQKTKNLTLAAALLAFVVVVYLVSIVRMGGG